MISGTKSGWAAVGLLLSSTAAVNAQDKANYPEVYTISPAGVNIQTGSYTYSETDIEIGPLKFIRSYGGPALVYQYAQDPSNLGTWQHNFGFGVNPFDSQPVGYFADVYTDGARARHNLVTGATWTPWSNEAQGTLLTQQANTNNFTYRNRNGDVYVFTNRLATTATYADGRVLTFSYDGSKLRQIKSSLGYAIVLEYPAGSNVPSSVCGYNLAVQAITAATTCSNATPPQTKVSYNYTAVANVTVLQTVTDRNGKVRSFTYAGTNLAPKLTCQTLVQSSTCLVTNYYENAYFPLKVTRQVTADQKTWTYGYSTDYNDFNPDGPPQIPGQNWYSGAGVQDPGGFTTGIDYTNGLATTAQLREGNQAYEWDGIELKKVTYPRGNSRIITRDERQNVTEDRRVAVPSSGDADIVSSASYPQGTGYPVTGCATEVPVKCNKPTYTIDERGNQTDYTYDPNHGGVLTETKPAVNGVRPQTRYSYVQRTAWISNGAGGYVQGGPPVWLLSQTSICKTGAATGNGCAIAGDEVVTTYDYGPNSGPNTLLLRGIVVDATGAALRTCYGYDVLGRRISETKPRAGLTSCP